MTNRYRDKLRQALTLARIDLWVSNSLSCGDRELDEIAGVGDPVPCENPAGRQFVGETGLLVWNC